MPEAVIVATGRTPIGRANKGLLVDCRPDDRAAHVREGRPRQAAPAARRTRLRTSSWAAPSRPASRATTWPKGLGGCAPRLEPPGSPSTVTAPRRCRP